MKKLLLVFALLFPVSAHAEWVIPEHPDPDTIYDEAQEDAKAHRYKLALEKYVWFHHNALNYNRSFYGVRLSYALSHWIDLAAVYPPALIKLKEVRNQAVYNVKNGINPYAFFHDLKSINEKLGEKERTLNLFKWLDSNQPDIARKVYRLAQPALLNANEYNLGGKYLDPRIEYKHLVKYFRLQKALEKEKNDPHFIGFADKRFTYGTATLVALLVHNNRRNEAELIVEQGKQEWENEQFRIALQVALQGQFPEPWP